MAVPLVRVSEVDRLRLVLPVPESAVPQIHVGLPIKIRVATLGREFHYDMLAAVVPHGLILPVLPGTRHLTIGGAVAADVHGKNQRRDGSMALFSSGSLPPRWLLLRPPRLKLRRAMVLFRPMERGSATFGRICHECLAAMFTVCNLDKHEELQVGIL